MQPYKENMLLYKNNDDGCRYFMGMLQKMNMLQHFELMPVDGKEMQVKASGITSVPAILLKGNKMPIFGIDANNWLNMMIQKNNPLNAPILLPPQQTQQQLPPQNPLNRPINQPMNGAMPQQPMGNSPLPSQKQEIVPPSQSEKKNPARMGMKLTSTAPPTEMNNTPITKPINKNPIPYLSAEMSGVSDAFAYTATDDPQPKNFLAPTDTCAIYTAVEGAKINNSELEKRIRSKATERDIDKKNYEKLIEQENNELVKSVRGLPSR